MGRSGGTRSSYRRRQGEDDAQAGVGVVGVEGAAVELNGALGDGEAKADAASGAVAVGVDTVEVCRRSRPRRPSPRDFLHRINHICSKRLSGKGDRCSDSFRGQAWMLRQDLVHGFSGRKLLQDQLHGDPGPGDSGFTHHDLGVGTDQSFWHLKPRFIPSLQQETDEIRARAAVEVHAVLTPEQRAKAKQVHEQIRDHMRQRWMQ